MVGSTIFDRDTGNNSAQVLFRNTHCISVYCYMEVMMLARCESVYSRMPQGAAQSNPDSVVGRSAKYWTGGTYSVGGYSEEQHNPMESSL